MRTSAIIALSIGTGLLLSGCIAKTAVDIVTAPVRAAAQVADWTTTSGDESDRARGRALREREEALGRLARQRDRYQSNCTRGDAAACAQVERINDEIETVNARPM